MTTPAELASRLRDIVACRLQGWHEMIICVILSQAATTIERLSKELEEAKEDAHDARGVADLAIKHRDEAEALLSSSRSDAIEEAARVADAYADENQRMAADTILIDPVLSGGPITTEAASRSKNLMVDGCIHSSMYHAAQNIAAAIRKLSEVDRD